MSKVFTLSEAQTLLPVLEGLLRRAREHALRAAELEAEMEALGQRIFLSGGMHVDVAAAARRRAEREKAVQEAKNIVGEIEAVGVELEDMEEGVLDFPCMVDGTLVSLCWKMGEETIKHWHETDAGFAERRAMDRRFGKTERERLN